MHTHTHTHTHTERDRAVIKERSVTIWIDSTYDTSHDDTSEHPRSGIVY